MVGLKSAGVNAETSSGRHEPGSGPTQDVPFCGVSIPLVTLGGYLCCSFDLNVGIILLYGYQ